MFSNFLPNSFIGAIYLGSTDHFNHFQLLWPLLMNTRLAESCSTDQDEISHEEIQNGLDITSEREGGSRETIYCCLTLPCIWALYRPISCKLGMTSHYKLHGYTSLTLAYNQGQRATRKRKGVHQSSREDYFESICLVGTLLSEKNYILSCRKSIQGRQP